ncbi:ubiquitin-associated domain-containing protein 1 [Tupaia chinensis]|uniref:ubiquitin-associated domain-containing protein 1 n=1 Tax=Tupaia chinensis TaxID=246437 RepID=UPI000FFC3233|nr:ubiquitin-associated domain-containing protein 1 [Tupaia chinensis]
MFVQEEKIFAGQVLRLHICAADGAEWLEEAAADTAVEQLKERCLKHCAHGSLEDPKSLSHHKLVHAASERVLNDPKTLLEENVQDQDVLLLIRKRHPAPLPKMADVSAEEKKKQDQKAPDRDAILKATAGLPSYSTDRAVAQTSMRDFQTELRKILVSLIEVAQKLLALNPDAVELFKKANAMLDEDDERVDEAALRQLTEMGFPETRAAKALRLSHMSVPQAMEWLIEHAEDPAIDVPLPGPAAPGATSEAAAAGTSSGDEPRDELTEIFKKIRRKREFRADARAVVSLMEMGFDEKDVMDALRVNNNQQNAACEWLLGDRKPSPEELDKGIDPDSPLFQAILDNPVVQLGLTNPKTLLGGCTQDVQYVVTKDGQTAAVCPRVSRPVLLPASRFLFPQRPCFPLPVELCHVSAVSCLAFEDMLENPLGSTQWMNDPETGPVMLQISRIFQTWDHQGAVARPGSPGPLEADAEEPRCPGSSVGMPTSLLHRSVRVLEPQQSPVLLRRRPGKHWRFSVTVLVHPLVKPSEPCPRPLYSPAPCLQLSLEHSTVDIRSPSCRAIRPACRYTGVLPIQQSALVATYPSWVCGCFEAGFKRLTSEPLLGPEDEF